MKPTRRHSEPLKARTVDAQRLRGVLPPARKPLAQPEPATGLERGIWTGGTYTPRAWVAPHDD